MLSIAILVATIKLDLWLYSSAGANSGVRGDGTEF